MIRVDRVLLAEVRFPEWQPRFAEGVTIVETPGHTPGHRSLVVESDGRRTVIAGQCVYKLVEVTERAVAPDNMHGETYAPAGQDSLERILALEPQAVVAAHDAGRCEL